MKIALLAARMPPAFDGVGDHADRLARTLANRGHSVVAVTTNEAGGSNEYDVKKIGDGWGAGTALAAAREITALQPDALLVEYTPFLYGPRSPVPIAALLAARTAKIPSAIIVHEAFYAATSEAVLSPFKAMILDARDRWTLRLADSIVVPSAARARIVERRLPAVRDRLKIVRIGANVEAPSNYERNPVRPARIVSFGVVSTRRRLERAVDALAQLVADGRDVRLDIVGRIYDTAYAGTISERARTLGIADRVAFRGELESAELSAAFSEATVAVHAAREGAIASSGSLIALLAHGVPVVALRTPFDDEVFAGALHYADDNDASLVAALRALVDEPAAAASLVTAARMRWQTEFSWDAVADGVLHALKTESLPGGPHVRAVAN